MDSMKINDNFKKRVLSSLNSSNITLALNKDVFDIYGTDFIKSVLYGAK